jgi:hypothetical protein
MGRKDGRTGMSTTQQPDDFCVEDLAYRPPWLKKPDEKPHLSSASNVVSFEQYRRAREKQQNDRTPG